MRLPATAEVSNTDSMDMSFSKPQKLAMDRDAWSASVHVLQGLKLGFCLTLGNELSEETHLPTKQKILLGKGTQVESSRVKEPRRTALPRGSQSRVL